MKGLAFLGVGKVGVIEKPIPDPGPNDAVIQTTASLVCTTDVHTVRGVIPLPAGRLLGHESVGVVYKVGTQVTRCQEGDRVAVCAITPCGRCDPCQRGYSSQCGGMLGGYKFTGQWDGNLRRILLCQRRRLQSRPHSTDAERRAGAVHHRHADDRPRQCGERRDSCGGDGGHFCPGTGGVVCDHRGAARRRWPRDCCGVEAGPAAAGQTIRR